MSFLAELKRRNAFKVTAAFLGALLVICSSQAMATTVDLRILETTDLHMHLLDYDYYRDATSPAMGLARTATLIKNARKQSRNSVLVDNGDLLQGNPMGDYVARGRGLRFGEVHPAYKAMNLLGYDVGNVGNHDFNYGLDFLMKSLHGADFPYISSNVVIDNGDDDARNDQPYFQPYVILPKTVFDSDGNAWQLNIGYIGFLPPQIMEWDHDKLSGLVRTRDIVATAQRYIPEMRAKGADIIIAIAHSGMYKNTRRGMDENAVYYLAKVPAIDAIVFGHSHRVFPGDELFDSYPGVDNKNGTVFGVPAVMPGFWGSHLGVIDLRLERNPQGQWRVAGSHAEARPVYRRKHGKVIPLVEPATGIAEAVAADHRGTLAHMARQVGVLSSGINSYFAMVVDDPSIQVVNDAQRWYARRILRGTSYADLPLLAAAAPFKTGGSAGLDYYTDVPAGDITMRNVADLYIYPNDLKIVSLSGRQVIEWLEKSAAVFNTIDPSSDGQQWLINEQVPSYNFDVIDGISYAIDLTRPPRYPGSGPMNPATRRIVDVRYQGRALDPEQQFLVVTNSYRAGGGGHYPALDGSTIVIDAPDKNRDVLAAYFLAHPTVDPAADGNWHFAATTGMAAVMLKTSPKARALAPKTLQYVDTMDDGLARFQVQITRPAK